MSRRLWIGWVQLGTVLIAAGIAMLMSGFPNHSTEYPATPTPAGAAAPVDRATGAQLPAHTAVLTFDGAPDGGGTPQLLDALRRAGVRATCPGPGGSWNWPPRSPPSSRRPAPPPRSPGRTVRPNRATP